MAENVADPLHGCWPCRPQNELQIEYASQFKTENSLKDQASWLNLAQKAKKGSDVTFIKRSVSGTFPK